MVVTHKTVLARLSVCALVVLGLMSGFFAERGQPLVAGIFLAADLLPVALLFKTESVEIGRPQMLPKQVRWEALISIGALLLPGIVWVLQFRLTFLRSFATFILFSAVVFVIGSFGSRGAYLTLSAFTWILGFNHLVFEDPGNVPRSLPFSTAYGAVLITSCSFVAYKRDQNMICYALTIGALSVVTGGYLSAGEGRGYLYLVMDLGLVYLFFLSLRRGRRLPACLQGCKFIRLSYLRRLAAQGGRIRRCQELPPEAFGDVTKALHLLIVSHRWMHRYTCDVITEEYPEGVRLRTMLQRLEFFFSTQGLGQGRSLVDRWRRLCWSLTGGRDVVLFFDFMSLPQEGLSPDGKVSLRSDEDLALFKRCLPHMGMLYSMNPILVCEEVVGDVAPYSSSGWCYSELSIGLLGKQLDMFSFNSEPVLELVRPNSLSGDGLKSFIDASSSELASKNFFVEGDREVVRGIISSFLLKSRLVDAITSKDAGSLSIVLDDIERLQLHDFLNQPVDASLNTPLHLAVAKNFGAGVERLLKRGAKRSCRNWYGDSPTQCRLLPRMTKAALACRVHEEGKITTPPMPSADIVGNPTTHFAMTPEDADASFDDEIASI